MVSMGLFNKIACQKCGKAVRMTFKVGKQLVCHDCYVMLEHPERLKKKKERPKILLSTSATYWGGHIKHPIGKNGESGRLLVTEEKITFNNITFLSKNKWTIEIPLEKVLWDKILIGTGKDIAYEQQMSGWAFFATGLPVSTYSRQTTFFTITFKDENNVVHSPKFQVKNTKEFSEVLYNRISKIKKRELTKEDAEEPLKVLKMRYAKGEISRKDFEQKKKDLEK